MRMLQDLPYRSVFSRSKSVQPMGKETNMRYFEHIMKTFKRISTSVQYYKAKYFAILNESQNNKTENYNDGISLNINDDSNYVNNTPMSTELSITSDYNHTQTNNKLSVCTQVLSYNQLKHTDEPVLQLNLFQNDFYFAPNSCIELIYHKMQAKTHDYKSQVFDIMKESVRDKFTNKEFLHVIKKYSLIFQTSYNSYADSEKKHLSAKFIMDNAMCLRKDLTKFCYFKEDLSNEISLGEFLYKLKVLNNAIKLNSKKMLKNGNKKNEIALVECQSTLENFSDDSAENSYENILHEMNSPEPRNMDNVTNIFIGNGDILKNDYENNNALSEDIGSTFLQIPVNTRENYMNSNYKVSTSLELPLSEHILQSDDFLQTEIYRNNDFNMAESDDNWISKKRKFEFISDANTTVTSKLSKNVCGYELSRKRLKTQIMPIDETEIKTNDNEKLFDSNEYSRPILNTNSLFSCECEPRNSNGINKVCIGHSCEYVSPNCFPQNSFPNTHFECNNFPYILKNEIDTGATEIDVKMESPLRDPSATDTKIFPTKTIFNKEEEITVGNHHILTLNKEESILNASLFTLKPAADDEPSKKSPTVCSCASNNDGYQGENCKNSTLKKDTVSNKNRLITPEMLKEIEVCKEWATVSINGSSNEKICKNLPLKSEETISNCNMFVTSETTDDNLSFKHDTFDISGNVLRNFNNLQTANANAYNNLPYSANSVDSGDYVHADKFKGTEFSKSKNEENTSNACNLDVRPECSLLSRPEGLTTVKELQTNRRFSAPCKPDNVERVFNMLHPRYKSVDFSSIYSNIPDLYSNKDDGPFPNDLVSNIPYCESRFNSEEKPLVDKMTETKPQRTAKLIALSRIKTRKSRMKSPIIANE